MVVEEEMKDREDFYPTLPWLWPYPDIDPKLSGPEKPIWWPDEGW